MDNVTQTILSQYRSSTPLVSKIGSLNSAIDPGADIDTFYTGLWDIDTAYGYGLDVLGEIVGCNRNIKIINDGEFFGFNGSSGAGFNQAPFYGVLTAIPTFSLPDSSFRKMIKCKAYCNISDGSINSYNSILMMLFSDYGDAWVTIPSHMTMKVNFSFTAPIVELAMLKYGNVFLPPAGVALTF